MKACLSLILVMVQLSAFTQCFGQQDANLSITGGWSATNGLTAETESGPVQLQVLVRPIQVRSFNSREQSMFLHLVYAAQGGRFWWGITHYDSLKNVKFYLNSNGLFGFYAWYLKLCFRQSAEVAKSSSEAQQQALALMGSQAGAITNMSVEAFSCIDLTSVFPRGAFREKLSAKVPSGPEITSISFTNSQWQFGLSGENRDRGTLVLDEAFHPVQASLNGKVVFPLGMSGSTSPP
jgi:hypothetical protein